MLFFADSRAACRCRGTALPLPPMPQTPRSPSARAMLSHPDRQIGAPLRARTPNINIRVRARSEIRTAPRIRRRTRRTAASPHTRTWCERVPPRNHGRCRRTRGRKKGLELLTDFNLCWDSENHGGAVSDKGRGGAGKGRREGVVVVARQRMRGSATAKNRRRHHEEAGAPRRKNGSATTKAPWRRGKVRIPQRV